MGFSSTEYIALTIGGCILFYIIIIMACCWRKRRTTEARSNEIFLHNLHTTNKRKDSQPQEQIPPKSSGTSYDSEIIANGEKEQQMQVIINKPNDSETQNNNKSTTNAQETLHTLTADTKKNNDETHISTNKKEPQMQHTINKDIEKDTQPPTTVTTHKSKPESMRIMLNDETLINGPFHHQSNDTTLVLDQTNTSYSASTTPSITKNNYHNSNNSILVEIKEENEEAYSKPMRPSNSSSNMRPPNNIHPRNESSTLDPMDGRASIKIHLSTDSFDPYADFTDHTEVDGNHGFGPSVQIHDSVDLNEVLLTDDALPVDTLPQHYLSDSVESLDPDFVLEAAYFEESSVYSSRQQEQHSLLPIPMDNDIDKGSTEWNMPGISIDHTASIQLLQSMQMFAPQNTSAANDVISSSITQTAVEDTSKDTIDTSAIGQSIQMEAAPGKIGKSIQYSNAPNTINTSAIGKSIQYEAAPNNTNHLSPAAETVSKSIQMTASSMGGEQFIMWQMHGRKLKNMSHEKLVEWLENSGFDGDTLDHFRKYKIDGKKLWQNIRNASMFLYNVGVVRPTLRDAIVQNIYLELLPKTPGFDERHMTDFKRLELICDGPISTVYRAVIKKEALKLRESIVVIKGYHFTADEVRVGKIIQILVHLVTNVQSSRFVKIHGFIRNMMEDAADHNLHKEQQRPMFGIVMEYCDGGSIYSMFKNGRTNHYNLEYNIMDKIGIIYEVALAISELHKKNTLHRNLKASNVLISNNDDIKLTDYCLDVTQLTDFTHSLDAKERSIRWMSPELIQTQTYSKACDIYSFGILCYEILSGKKPYSLCNDIQDLLRKIISENLRPNIDDLANFPEDLLVLMTNCWAEDAQQRPDFEEILDELDKIKHELRTKCITFDDIYARARASMIDGFKKGAKSYQSSPLLTMQEEETDSDEDDDDDVNTFDHYHYHLNKASEYDDNDEDDEKFQQLLAPYNKKNKPTHSKDDTALELDKVKIFEPNRRRKFKKKRPRKPLPKAPPVKKELPQIENDVQIINEKRVQLHDKPLPPKPLNQQ